MAWPFFEVNAVYSTSATWASETQQPSWSSQIARVADRHAGVGRDGGDGRGDLDVHGHRDREPGAGTADLMTEVGGVVRRVRPHDDRPAAPGLPGCGGEPGRAADGVRGPAAQPGAGDHRRDQRRADRRGQRVQPTDQQVLTLDLGMPKPGPLLAPPVDPLFASRRYPRTPASPCRPAPTGSPPPVAARSPR